MHPVIRSGLLVGAALLPVVSFAQADAVLIEPTAIASASRTDSSDGPTTAFDAVEPAIAAAPEHRVALVVWSADDASVPAGGDEDELHLVDGEMEIFGRLVKTSTLLRIGDPQRLSVMGDDAESDKENRQRFDATTPAVAWNPVAQEFLVAWQGDDDTAPLVDDEFEIFGQRVGVDGKPVGERIRISVMGDDTAADAAIRQTHGAAHPVITVDPVNGNYLVAWQGDDNGETEIFARLLDANGAPLDEQFRVSFAGVDGDPATDAVAPAAIFNPVSKLFFLAWQADDAVDGEDEIFVQAVDASGALSGTATAISAMGAPGDAAFDANAPALAVDPATGFMLVAWHGDTDEGALVDEELEIFARLLDPNAVPDGEQFRVSTMGTDGDVDYGAADVAVAWSETDARFFAVWRADSDEEFEIESEDEDEEPETFEMVDDEFEIFGRFIEVDGSMPESQFRISHQGRDDVEEAEDRSKFDAADPVVAFSNGVLLTAWSGDHNVPSGYDGHQRIFATRIATSATTLTIEPGDDYEQSVVPDPIRLTMTVTNDGEIDAERVAVQVLMTNDLPLSFEGCESTATDTCELGSIPAGETASFTVILETSHLTLEDELGTTLTFVTVTDTALVDIEQSARQLFVGAMLKIDGGAGALGWTWLLLLGVVPLARAARRRR